MEQSDYIVFADESGDHGLVSIDEQFPVFALVFAIMRKSDYIAQVMKPYTELKFELWGHDQVILHESDIRKERGDFALLRTDRNLREQFYSRLTQIMAGADAKFVVSIIDKKKLTQRYRDPFNPYELSLLFCLERTLRYLVRMGQAGKNTCILFESRGRTEDDQLELEFLRIINGQSTWGYRSEDFSQLHFTHKFISKKSNCSGLQFTDLAARPLALRYMRPKQANRAYDILQPKIEEIKCFP